jgi:glutamine amidotransferase
MLRKVGAAPFLAQRPPELLGAVPVLLPGIGAFDEGMMRLEKSGWRDVLADLPPEHHVLGICLGMQLLGRGSEEGSAQGLGRVDMACRRFTRVERVPHMGWNRVLPSEDPLFAGQDQERRFYFAHSFHAVCSDPADVIGETVYGAPFPSAVRRGNTVGFQFHPEKSHRFGMALLREWVASTC